MDGGRATPQGGATQPGRESGAQMTPGARLQTAIELLHEIEARPDIPADSVVTEGFRARRYAGSKDRRAVAALAFGVLRRRRQIDWWLARADILATARTRVLAFHQLAAGVDIGAMASICPDGPHAPAPLDAQEQGLARLLDGQTFDHPEQPPAVTGNAPDWLYRRFLCRFGESASAELKALELEASVDLRVNTLKTTREAVRTALRSEGVESAPTLLSPIGLRLSGRRALGGVSAYRDGLVEVQDEGSQIAALLVDARPGMTAVDFCAGAGGKTLALAAQMQNEGRILAFDVAAGRLKRAAERLVRAGVTIAETQAFGGPPGAPEVGRLESTADRVLVDAPCTGTGAWRRRPEDRWRLSEAALDELVAVQDGILDRAARLVRRGGRMVYVTCSLLLDENEGRIAAFLARRPGFGRIDIRGVWKDVLTPECPATAEDLLLTPARHGVDGFYVCVLERTE